MDIKTIYFDFISLIIIICGEETITYIVFFINKSELKLCSETKKNKKKKSKEGTNAMFRIYGFIIICLKRILRKNQV